ncbi:MAG: potassium channel protein [Frankiales bacterium]|nr:potassium channel protein [Frankiales bacterium]
MAVRPLQYHSRNARRLVIALVALSAVLVVGTLGYVLLGIDLLDAAYQTVTTVTTIGFREVVDFGPAQKIYTMVLALVGVGTVLYTLTLTLELVLEGQLGNLWGRRQMQRDIDRLEGHAVVCGWGRVGKAAAEQLARAGQAVVIIDRDEERLGSCPYPHILGDATDDEVLRAAGIRLARTLVASLDNDAGSVYVVLSARSLNPDLFVIARSRTDDAEPKFVRAGADRVVNPQRIGGNRIAAFAESPYVVDFLDVVMHEGSNEFRMVDVEVQDGSALQGSTVADTRAREGGAAILLALRTDGRFVTNPAPSTVVGPGDVLIAVGTEEQIRDLRRQAARS